MARGSDIWSYVSLISLLTIALVTLQTVANPLVDPCAAIAGKRWVTPAQARACMFSFRLDPKIKANILEVVSKTLAFHTSANFQIQAPPPYEHDVREDLYADLQRISRTSYSSEFAFHLDVYRSFQNVKDGHCGVYNFCYDSFYVTYLPLPLVLVTNEAGGQDVHIAPEAFTVASDEFGPAQMKVWQASLPFPLTGRLQSLSGAKVHLINGEDPFIAVNMNADEVGGYQSFGTRQNGFFSSYNSASFGWSYRLGNFAQKPHPLVDSVELTVQRVGSNTLETFKIPYYARFERRDWFKDSASYRASYCVANSGTNGRDRYSAKFDSNSNIQSLPAIAAFQQQPTLSPEEYHKHPMNVILNAIPLMDASLPKHLLPTAPALSSSYSVARFYMLDDKVTGVLALGSFSADDFNVFGARLLSGLQDLKKKGAKQLIVDVTNNGGGYVCIAHWLHRIIIGPSKTTVPQAGLDTVLRSGPLAQLIVKKINSGGDPRNLMKYNPQHFTNATHHQFKSTDNYIKPYPVWINGKRDAFSQRLGQECQPFSSWDPPKQGLFDPANVVIVSNGHCASSCSLFSITMAKKDGVKTVVVGGKFDTPQDYCGTVGGQATGFEFVDSEVKSAKLKGHRLAPPDFLTNSVQGITWRLGLGVDSIYEAEEWQDHQADINFPVTLGTVNKPMAIWQEIADEHLPYNQRTFQIQEAY